VTTYTWAHEVEEIAKDLIATKHERLAAATIAYVFRSPPAKSHGRLVLGKARKVSGLAAWLAEISPTGSPFFVLEVAIEPWDQASTRRRYALVDHELCHMVDEGEGLAIRGHDVEEFIEVIERHGIWRRDLDVLNLALQAATPYDGDEDD
jgi:predicted metallopeptidase